MKDYVTLPLRGILSSAKLMLELLSNTCVYLGCQEDFYAKRGEQWGYEVDKGLTAENNNNRDTIDEGECDINDYDSTQ